MHMNRREFIGTTALLAGATFLNGQAADRAAQRRFNLNLMPGMIGVGAKSQWELNELAAKHGFESVEPLGGDLASMDAAALSALREEMQRQKLVWGAANLPVDFRGEDEPFQRGVRELPRIAAGLQRAGVKRVGTWISPASQTLTYQKNFGRHVERLGQIARILDAHGLKLGFEYIGTYTLRANRRFPFIHTMEECEELISALPTKNVGLVLDSWHWWQAEDKVEDILKLKPEQIVAVDLNDAPQGRKKQEQQDGQRELPSATGVIPIADFLKALVTVGYDGPVRAEPFNKPLNEMNNDDACAATIAALRKSVEGWGA